VRAARESEAGKKEKRRRGEEGGAGIKVCRGKRFAEDHRPQ